MSSSNNKTSVLVASQLPEFIRDNPEYANFTLFMQAYYEWMEQTNQVTDRTKNLLSYRDVDSTTNEFIDYFVNDFLPYFPAETLIDKREAVKVARQLYQSKGTPASYQFLFRILFNSDFDVFYTRDAVLRASSGLWYVTKSLRLSTTDTNFLNIENLRLFGETTKSIATIENSVVSGTKIEVFISNIERLFQSGEFVRVVDSNNQTVLFDGLPLRAKIVGQISQLKINPNYRGLLYQPGDPVIVYGGLNSNTGLGASGQIISTTAGSIQSISVITGGYGYRYAPNSYITITNAPGASAEVATLNPANEMDVTIPNDSISLKRFIAIGNSNYHFANVAIANANTSLANAFTFVSFQTYPISTISVLNGGGGITQIPSVSATSLYEDDVGNLNDLAKLGILGPIQIVNGGAGYQVNDTIVFSGGSGAGARANVTNVSATGAITEIRYVSGPRLIYPLGGAGYKTTALPTLTVSSANGAASNASLYIPGILGEGATFSVVADRAGSITTIKLTEPGEDYISTPNVSFKIQDILVSNVSISMLPQKDDFVYQGTSSNTTTYAAYVDSITQLTTDTNPYLSNYNLRVYNYNTLPNTALQLTVDGKNINMIPAGSSTPYPGVVSSYTTGGTTYTRSYNSSGLIIYGDGNARGTATFLNGLAISEGVYLNTTGQPSSFDVLQSENYNNFTYEITVEKEIAKYRDVLLNLLHPTGTKLVGRFAMKSNNAVNYHGTEAVYQGKTLQNYTGYPASSVSMVADFNNRSNNIIHFDNLSGADISGFIFSNSTIQIIPVNGPAISSQVQSINSAANTVTLKSNTWLTFGNVAYVSANTTSNVINILSVTNNYDIINSGQYSNTSYPIKDIVFAGDRILIGSNTSNTRTVTAVDWVGGKIYLSSNANITTSNTLMAVNRTLSAQTNVTIYGPIGTTYVPQLTTEDGQILTTEDGNIILLG